MTRGRLKPSAPAVGAPQGRASDGDDARQAASDELLVEANPFETRIALLRNGRPIEIHLERTGQDPDADADGLVGNIYLGRVARLAPSIQAVFVDIGGEVLGALFSSDNHAPNCRLGDKLLVQVAKAPVKGRGERHGKGPRLTTNVSLAGKYLIALPLAVANRASANSRASGEALDAGAPSAGRKRSANHALAVEDRWHTHISVSRRIDDQAARQRLTTATRQALVQARLPWDCVVRTAASVATEADISSDIAYLKRLWGRIGHRRKRVKDVPALVHREMPAALRAVRDYAGPQLRQVLVNDDEALDAIRTHIAARLPAFRSKIARYRGATQLFQAYGVEDTINAVLDPRVPLPGGGALVIEHTEAMTTIDVNSGSGNAQPRVLATLRSSLIEPGAATKMALRTNLEAARAIPEALRLRNIGGIVVVDFIGMATDEHREAVRATLIDAAADDPGRVTVSGFSGLGLVEISRRRVRESLVATLTGPCPTCLNLGYAKSAESTCLDVFRALVTQERLDGAGIAKYVVHGPEAVIDRLLDEDAGRLAAVIDRIGCPVELQVEPGYRTDQFDLIGAP